MKARATLYGGNKESKKVQRTLLKQQYENFAALSSDTIDQTFDRLQKLISQLEIHGEVINQEDMNLNLLRSLPSEWKTHALIWKNKVEIETISLDDFTNNTNNTNKADDTAHGVSTTHTTIPYSRNGSLNRDGIAQQLEQKGWVYPKNSKKLEHKRFLKNQEYKGRENNTRTIAVDTPTQNALIAQDGNRGYDWSYQDEEKQPTNHALMAFTSSGSYSSSYSEFKTRLGYDAATAASPAVESFVNLTDKSGLDKGYHLVPPPLTRNFIPRKPDLTFVDEIVESENLDVTTVVTPSNNKTVENKGVSNIVKSNLLRRNNTSGSNHLRLNS
ncbi:hypothetical protein Tco_0729211 [Tanacetum coccineum]|uniref:Uncharacterized protein n=1 Tax=Tanacetum coccineum TaxID=301880 RepID=A0ABQ4YQP8_9ASTR